MSTNLTTTLTEERNTAGARLDVKLHDLLRAPSTQRARVRAAEPLTLPTPVFPQHPELLTDVALPSDAHGRRTIRTHGDGGLRTFCER